MNKDYQILQEGLDKAAQRGVFNLQESSYILTALRNVSASLKQLEDLRKEVAEANTKNLKPVEGDKV
tara:strand:+ start:7733 stop:7933 length:201 start_codon:yes stop_codon:yes gene_type:complete